MGEDEEEARSEVESVEEKRKEGRRKEAGELVRSESRWK
jgi:hypothetical protein